MFLLLLLTFSLVAKRSSPRLRIHRRRDAYTAGDFERAAEAFRQSATRQPASGTLQTLGWRSGSVQNRLRNPGLEQALWLDPFNNRPGRICVRSQAAQLGRRSFPGMKSCRVGCR